MSVQFELGTKHLENKKQANIAVTESQSGEIKDIVKELLNRFYGVIPSDKAPYNDYLGLTVSLEEIAKVAPEAASVLTDQVLAQELVKNYGSTELGTTQIYGILCAEPGIADIQSLAAKAINNGGNWHVEGTKLIRKEHLIADKYLIFARDEEDNIRVFMTSEENISINSVTKSVAGSDVALNQIKLNIDFAQEDCIAVINDDFEKYQSIAKTLIAGVALGIGHSTIVAGIVTTKEVKDAANQSISGTQSVQFALSDMYAELEAARMLTYLSADLIDNNKANIKYATMAKVQATDTASQNSIQALQMLGNFGYLANNDFADIIRLAVDGQVKGGTNRVQRNQIYKYMLAKK